jgi:hypothetical protein
VRGQVVQYNSIGERDLEEIIAFCGLDCHECGAFLATQENDDQKRATVAQEWSRLFKVEIKLEDINCDGCLSEGGRVFNYRKVCEIRKCGKGKSLKNCGYCGKYPYQKLDFIFSNAPDAKNRLYKINFSFK